MSDGEQRNGTYFYSARVRKIEDTEENADFKIRLSHNEALPGKTDDTVRCTVRFYRFQDRFGLSSRTSCLAKGLVLGAYITDFESVEVIPAQKHTLRYRFAAWRNHLHGLLLDHLPKAEASVLSAMLLGLRGEIPEDLNYAYQAAGASHILVISGMHMAIVSNFALGALLLLGLRRRWAAGISIVFILLFMGLSGFSASVVRSGIMQILLLFGILVGRSTDALNSLAVALLVLMLTNPFCAGDISLLLSFSSTLGIILVTPQLTHRCTAQIRSVRVRSLVSRITLPVFSAVGAVLGSLPVQIYVFGSVNLTSIFTSLFVLYISAWIVRLGAGALVLLSVPALVDAAKPLLFASGLLTRLQNALIRRIGAVVSFQIELSGLVLPVTLLVILVFLLLAFWLYKGKRIPLLAYILSFMLLVGGVLAQSSAIQRAPRLLILDTGYAGCTALTYGRTAIILDCSGSGTTVSQLLREQGIAEISLLHLHGKETEIRCAETLLQEFETETVLHENDVFYAETPPASVYDYGGRVELDDGTLMEITENGDRIRISYKTLSILLADDLIGAESDPADILVTESLETAASAPLTVLRTGADIHIDALPTGNYLFSEEHPVLCLTLWPDGTYSIHQG